MLQALIWMTKLADLVWSDHLLQVMEKFEACQLSKTGKQNIARVLLF